MCLGVKAPNPARTFLAQICSVIYFGFFLLMPIWTAMDKTKPVPERVTMDGGIGFWGSMGGLALILALTILPLKAVGAESAYNCGSMPCDELDAESTRQGFPAKWGQALYELLYGVSLAEVCPLQSRSR